MQAEYEDYLTEERNFLRGLGLYEEPEEDEAPKEDEEGADS